MLIITKETLPNFVLLSVRLLVVKSYSLSGCLWIRDVIVGIKAYALDSWQFEDKFDTLAHVGRVWVQISLIYISVFEVQMTIISPLPIPLW
jgi:hypothetical protein